MPWLLLGRAWVRAPARIGRPWAEAAGGPYGGPVGGTSVAPRGVHDDRHAREADQGARDVPAVGSVAVGRHAPQDRALPRRCRRTRRGCGRSGRRAGRWRRNRRRRGRGCRPWSTSSPGAPVRPARPARLRRSRRGRRRRRGRRSGLRAWGSASHAGPRGPVSPDGGRLSAAVRGIRPCDHGGRPSAVRSGWHAGACGGAARSERACVADGRGGATGAHGHACGAVRAGSRLLSEGVGSCSGGGVRFGNRWGWGVVLRVRSYS